MKIADDAVARVDAKRITEVLVQLLENAAKYSPPESMIRVTSELRDGKLEVSVADQGVGIDDMEQALIFDKFYRGKSERYRVQGTGMGLAIAKAIVEAHGGTIRVTSQMGAGQCSASRYRREDGPEGLFPLTNCRSLACCANS